MLKRLDLSGNPYIGVYAAASERLLVVGREVPERAARAMSEALGVRVARSSIAGASVVGSLIAMNSNGAVITSLAEDGEVAALGLERVLRIPHRLNAVGNNVLCNDRGAVVHPGFDAETVEEISEALGVPAEHGTVAGIRTVGSAAVATNKGILCHPHAAPEETKLLEEVLGVPAMTTTANYGTPQVGACIVANSRGAAVGNRTTPIELGRIEEGLGYL